MTSKRSSVKCFVLGMKTENNTDNIPASARPSHSLSCSDPEQCPARDLPGPTGPPAIVSGWLDRGRAGCHVRVGRVRVGLHDFRFLISFPALGAACNYLRVSK